MKKLLSLLLIVFCVSVAQAEIPKEKRAEIERLLRLTGVEKLGIQMLAQMTTMLRQQMKEVPDVFWNKFEQKVDFRELTEMIVPLYDKYYTVEDLKSMNAFYETPAGQKILATLPQIMQESMKIGVEWGQGIARKAAEEAMRELGKKVDRSGI